ncbi:MAG TPA: HAD-IA family hydrolase [Puia sp.]
MIKMVVFDMAGTTVNENMVVYKTLQKAINEAGFDFSLEQVLAVGAGQEKLSAIKDVLRVYAQRDDDKLADSIYQNFIVLLEKAYDTLEILSQDHAKETFEALKQRDILVVLNTGYNQKTAQSLVEKLGWKKGVEFDGLVTATDVLHNRPKPDMILLAMDQFDIRDAGEVVKVGDSIIDIEEGRNAGCGLSIGITTGAHTPEQLESAKPDYVIDDLLELLPIVDKGNV